METLKVIFACIGVLYIGYLCVGLVIDITTFDQTRGGYQAPFEGWTGKPVDWDSMDRTSTGLVKRGYVIDVHIHGTSGMISFECFGLERNWQTPSARALIVHQPKEALIRRGFNPQF